MKEKKEGTSVPLMNEKIRFEKIQVIASDGTNLGVIPLAQALGIARQEELYLVLLSETGGQGAPVARVMDYGKVLYAKKKQQADAKKHQKVIQIKEVKLRPKIGEHDYQTKINQAIDFLKDGKHLKVTLMFKGREAELSREKGEDMFLKINKSFEVAGFTKIVQEKDSKTNQFWSRIYYLKK